MVTLGVGNPAKGAVVVPPYHLALSESHRHVLEIISALGTVRDAAHLQHCVYLAQEFKLLSRRYWFAADGKIAGLPYSHVLEDHITNLIAWGIVDRVTSHPGVTPLLRRVRDASPGFTPAGADALSILSDLGADDVAALAHAVLLLSRQGRHPAQQRFYSDVRATLCSAVDDSPPSVETRVKRIADVCWGLGELSRQTTTAAAYAS